MYMIIKDNTNNNENFELSSFSLYLLNFKLRGYIHMSWFQKLVYFMVFFFYVNKEDRMCVRSFWGLV